MNPARPVSMSSTFNDPVHKLGFHLLSIYFFFNYSRVLDITVPSLHLPLIVGLGLYATAALSGSVQKSVATIAGRLLVVLTGIMLLAALLGAWPGGSIKVISDFWLKAFPFYFTIVGLCTATPHLFRFMRTVVTGLAVMSCIALWRGDNILGRLIIDNSRFADPNDLALVCLIGLALCGFLITQKGNNWTKALGVAMSLPILYALSRTGSRGAMMGFAAGVVYLFIKSSITGKMKMMIILGACVFFSIAVLPPEVYMRYTGMVSDTSASETDEMQAAESSGEARFHLFQQSLIMTARHPLLGVGAGNFSVVENEMAQASGQARGAWHETHNMYTQMSSENGVLAAILYIAVIVLAMGSTKRTRKLAKHHPDPFSVERAAFWIRLSLIVFSVSGFFLTVAYSDMLPLLSGLAIALEIAVRNELRIAAPPQPAAAPVRAPEFTPVLAGVRR